MLPISFKTDYNLLESLIKVSDLLELSINKKSSYIGVLEDNPYSFMDLYTKAEVNSLKCIYGISIKYKNIEFYLYLKNYNGYLNIIKIFELVCKNKFTLKHLEAYSEGLLCILPINLITKIEYFKNNFTTFISYSNEKELETIINHGLQPIFIKRFISLHENIHYIDAMNYISGKKIEGDIYTKELNDADYVYIENFINQINLVIPNKSINLPSYKGNIEEGFNYLRQLCFYGIKKRLNNQILKKYVERLNYELEVIKKMGFVDYFLIVYDYVKYAKTNQIYVGPGRGSAAGSLVSYSLGITEIDPLKYSLLFERFLNPDRVTLPDIDIDFEDEKRYKVIDYVKKKYGEENVALIVSYGTFGTKQSIRDVGKFLNINDKIIDNLSKKLNPKISLKDNLCNNIVKSYIEENHLEKLFEISQIIEGIKKHTTIHAAGVVISSNNLLNTLPIYHGQDSILTGYTMEYLERLGLIKMDFLALRNLSIIHKTVDEIKKNNKDFNLNTIPLNDEKTYKIFKNGDTDNIFQFESIGMKNFLKKLNPDSFDDLCAANALFRPGPMDNIDKYINQKKGLEKINYYHTSLIPILKDTYGIIVYQEQIMQILSIMGGFTFAEADLIRRAMSKKKKNIIDESRVKFINNSISKGYSISTSQEIYNMIVKFSNYGFNKSHSVSYALIGYQTAYLKANYPAEYNLINLNASSSSSDKIVDIVNSSRKNGLIICKPDINLSRDVYYIENDKLILPLTSIKGITSSISKTIMANAPYNDFYDFCSWMFSNNCSDDVLKKLIIAGALSCFNYNRTTLINNLENVKLYADLLLSLGSDYALKPEIVVYEDDNMEIDELDIFGYYIDGHPASKITLENRVYLNKIMDFKNFNINIAFLVEKIKIIKTKKNEEMAFIKISDESDTNELIIFPKQKEYINYLKEKNSYKASVNIKIKDGEYQIILNKLID